MPEIHPARLCLIAELPDVPATVRLVGRVVGRDSHTSIVVLDDQGAGILVDLTVALGTADTSSKSGTFFPLVKDLIMVTGDLRENSNNIAIPSITSLSAAPSISSNSILSAHIMKPCADLDLASWREAVHAVNSVKR